ncbi:hypothetical protein NUW54_g9688 [Trametes sanguinea]|uniref:Uncharacterized protein n=1 Tax=Trametes sanguinea TaxID=158606 RepID=A0ACC1P5F2_9APHY|nr:hypothetical protein NUW54_g9688 [Trametes sanguinea]
MYSPPYPVPDDLRDMHRRSHVQHDPYNNLQPDWNLLAQQHFGEDIFVIQVPRTTEYSELVDKVGKKIRLCGPRRDDGPLRVKYKDEDGDLVSLGSTEDVQMAERLLGDSLLYSSCVTSSTTTTHISNPIIIMHGSSVPPAAHDPRLSRTLHLTLVITISPSSIILISGDLRRICAHSFVRRFLPLRSMSVSRPTTILPAVDVSLSSLRSGLFPAPNATCPGSRLYTEAGDMHTIPARLSPVRRRLLSSFPVAALPPLDPPPLFPAHHHVTPSSSHLAASVLPSVLSHLLVRIWLQLRSVVGRFPPVVSPPSPYVPFDLLSSSSSPFVPSSLSLSHISGACIQRTGGRGACGNSRSFA